MNDTSHGANQTGLHHAELSQRGVALVGQRAATQSMNPERLTQNHVSLHGPSLLPQA